VSVRVLAISFDHARGQAGACTLPLRVNESQAVPLPEWTFASRGSCAVAYRVDRLPPITYVLVRFAASPGEAAVVEVRARAVVSDSAIPLLPDLPPTLIGFGPGWDSGWCALPFETRSLGSTVAAQTCEWIWQFRRGAASPWIDFDSSIVRVYVVLAAPTLPWSLSPPTPANTSLPWVEVLDVACAWARTARDAIEASVLITRRVNALGGSLFLYDAEVGAPHYTVLGAPRFLCAAFLDRLRGGQGMGPLVNCSDCATIVSTFANVLGADLWQSKMGLVGAGFQLNPILAIGRAQWSVGWGGFSFHEVAWSGACGAADAVFDACLHTDEDTDPTQAPHRPSLPANQVFGMPGSGHFRDQIAAPEARDLCVPQPALRIRRPVIAQAIVLRSAATLTLSYAPAEQLRSLARAPAPEADEYRFEGFFFGGNELPGWSLSNTLDSYVVPRPSALLTNLTAAAQLTDVARVHVSVWTDPHDSAARLRVESIETASPAEARATLAQVVTEIECPLIELADGGTGDIGYRTPNRALALFVRGNHVHIVRSAGTHCVHVDRDAARIDEWITTAGTPAAQQTGPESATALNAPSSVSPRCWRRLRFFGATPRADVPRGPLRAIEYVVSPDELRR
jgi:hypothetical protein